MQSITILNAAIIMHICGIAFWAGTTVVDYISHRRFRKTYKEDTDNGRAAFRIISHLAGLILVSNCF